MSPREGQKSPQRKKLVARESPPLTRSAMKKPHPASSTNFFCEGKKLITENSLSVSANLYPLSFLISLYLLSCPYLYLPLSCSHPSLSRLYISNSSLSSVSLRLASLFPSLCVCVSVDLSHHFVLTLSLIPCMHLTLISLTTISISFLTPLISL